MTEPIPETALHDSHCACDKCDARDEAIFVSLGPEALVRANTEAVLVVEPRIWDYDETRLYLNGDYVAILESNGEDDAVCRQLVIDAQGQDNVKVERERIANLIMAEIDKRDPNGAGRTALLDVWHLIAGGQA